MIAHIGVLLSGCCKWWVDRTPLPDKWREFLGSLGALGMNSSVPVQWVLSRATIVSRFRGLPPRLFAEWPGLRPLLVLRERVYPLRCLGVGRVVVSWPDIQFVWVN